MLARCIVLTLSLVICSLLHRSVASRIPGSLQDTPAADAEGNIVLKSVSHTPTCMPYRYDRVALELLKCFNSFSVSVTGYAIRATSTSASGLIPCDFISLQGNLTGDTVARVVHELDEQGLVGYVLEHENVLEDLYVTSAEDLVNAVNQYLTDFLQTTKYYEAVLKTSENDGFPTSTNGGFEDGVVTEVDRKPFRSAGILYRGGRKVILKNPGSCRLKYEIDRESKVLQPRSHGEKHALWRAIYVTAALSSIALTIAGVSLCTCYSRRHAEYVVQHFDQIRVDVEKKEKQSLAERVFGKCPVPRVGGPPPKPTEALQEPLLGVCVAEAEEVQEIVKAPDIPSSSNTA